ncbi:uncharacterized protein LOC116846493 [Odontomachus brunneus]|uniref:uncharacterized protein LOC116846493 n=1 Tax=Odontomachus brunneus TaxID=486640 RepID=UPI0013F265FC|nr:uncharacterized protein LOC116846493 [Odontomachus brunneus]XP_032676296.1 uncharacterized protein LOC116846493 [Odontomachus brunneus]
MGSVSLDSRSMENDQERVLLDGGSRTARAAKQDPKQPAANSEYQSNFWGSLRQTTSDDSARDGDEHARQRETGEHLETLKFAKKSKDRGGRKANSSKRRVTFADH